MATEELIALMTKQLQLQQQQMEQQQSDNMKLMELLLEREEMAGGTTPSFTEFDRNIQLWADYLARFQIFLRANSIKPHKEAQAFWTDQSTVIYKLLSDWAEQQTPKIKVKDITMEIITNFMKEQYNPRKFIIGERHRFWSEMKRKPGETIQELAARIRHDDTTCVFPSIQNPQDEALRTRFICSISNEAVLKALF